MKIILLIALLASGAYAGGFAGTDTAAVNFPPSMRPTIRVRNSNPNGWKFNFEEWIMLRAPRYYKDKEHGSNGGYDYA